MKSYIKIEKVIKIDDIEIEKEKFHQHKETTSIKKIEILIQEQYPIRSLLVKKDLNILLASRMLKKLDLYVYFCQKWLHIEKILIKLNIWLFGKRWWIIRKM